MSSGLKIEARSSTFVDSKRKMRERKKWRARRHGEGVAVPLGLQVML